MKRYAGLLVLIAIGAVPLMVHHAAAQQDSPSSAADTAASGSATVAPSTTSSAAEATLQDLKDRRAANPLIEPIVKPAMDAPRARGETTGPDSGVLGWAPGTKAGPLRREGEFLIDRRGRLAQSPRTGQVMFQFDADRQGSPETPMILLPCRLLENMEELVAERGDRIVFKVTGQVFVYRGTNYMLPTLFTLAADKGNLQQ